MKVGSISIDPRELTFEFVRSSGPGGQNVNRVKTKAVLRWNLLTSKSLTKTTRDRLLMLWGRKINSGGELLITSDRYRTQRQNQEDALEKLDKMVQSAAKPSKSRRPTTPTQASKLRRIRQKKIRSKKKERRRDPSRDP